MALLRTTTQGIEIVTLYLRRRPIHCNVIIKNMFKGTCMGNLSQVPLAVVNLVRLILPLY